MKKLCYSLLLCFLGACSDSQPPSSKEGDLIADMTSANANIPRTKVQLIDSVLDMGIIEKGKVYTHDFKIKNIGQQPLIIKNITTSCGCTVADYPKKPIPPGELAIIHGAYDSRQGTEGRIYKTISVLLNGESDLVSLEIKGKLIGKEN